MADSDTFWTDLATVDGTLNVNAAEGRYDPSLLTNKDLDEKDLLKDPSWIAACRRIYEMEEGEDAALAKSDPKFDQDIAEWGLTHMSWFSYNSVSTVDNTMEIFDDDTTPDQKKAFLYMLQAFEAKNISAWGLARGLGMGAADPLNWLSVASLGLAYAGKKGAQIAARKTMVAFLKEAVKKAAKEDIKKGAKKEVVDQMIDKAKKDTALKLGEKFVKKTAKKKVAEEALEKVAKELTEEASERGLKKATGTFLSKTGWKTRLDPKAYAIGTGIAAADTFLMEGARDRFSTQNIEITGGLRAEGDHDLLRATGHGMQGAMFAPAFGLMTPFAPGLTKFVAPKIPRFELFTHAFKVKVGKPLLKIAKSPFYAPTYFAPKRYWLLMTKAIRNSAHAVQDFSSTMLAGMLDETSLHKTNNYKSKWSLVDVDGKIIKNEQGKHTRETLSAKSAVDTLKKSAKSSEDSTNKFIHEIKGKTDSSGNKTRGIIDDIRDLTDKLNGLEYLDTLTTILEKRQGRLKKDIDRIDLDKTSKNGSLAETNKEVRTVISQYRSDIIEAFHLAENDLKNSGKTGAEKADDMRKAADIETVRKAFESETNRITKTLVDHHPDATKGTLDTLAKGGNKAAQEALEGMKKLELKEGGNPEGFFHERAFDILDDLINGKGNAKNDSGLRQEAENALQELNKAVLSTGRVKNQLQALADFASKKNEGWKGEISEKYKEINAALNNHKEQIETSSKEAVDSLDSVLIAGHKTKAAAEQLERVITTTENRGNKIQTDIIKRVKNEGTREALDELGDNALKDAGKTKTEIKNLLRQATDDIGDLAGDLNDSLSIEGAKKNLNDLADSLKNLQETSSHYINTKTKANEALGKIKRSKDYAFENIETKGKNDLTKWERFRNTYSFPIIRSSIGYHDKDISLPSKFISKESYIPFGADYYLSADGKTLIDRMEDAQNARQIGSVWGKIGGEKNDVQSDASPKTMAATKISSLIQKEDGFRLLGEEGILDSMARLMRTFGQKENGDKGVEPDRSAGIPEALAGLLEDYAYKSNGKNVTLRAAEKIAHLDGKQQRMQNTHLRQSNMKFHDISRHKEWARDMDSDASGKTQKSYKDADAWTHPLQRGFFPLLMFDQGHLTNKGQFLYMAPVKDADGKNTKELEFSKWRITWAPTTTLATLGYGAKWLFSPDEADASTNIPEDALLKEKTRKPTSTEKHSDLGKELTKNKKRLNALHVEITQRRNDRIAEKEKMRATPGFIKTHPRYKELTTEIAALRQKSAPPAGASVSQQIKAFTQPIALLPSEMDEIRNLERLIPEQEAELATLLPFVVLEKTIKDAEEDFKTKEETLKTARDKSEKLNNATPLNPAAIQNAMNDFTLKKQQAKAAESALATARQALRNAAATTLITTADPTANPPAVIPAVISGQTQQQAAATGTAGAPSASTTTQPGQTPAAPINPPAAVSGGNVMAPIIATPPTGTPELTLAALGGIKTWLTSNDATPWPADIIARENTYVDSHIHALNAAKATPDKADDTFPHGNANIYIANFYIMRNEAAKRLKASGKTLDKLDILLAAPGETGPREYQERKDKRDALKTAYDAHTNGTGAYVSGTVLSDALAVLSILETEKLAADEGLRIRNEHITKLTEAKVWYSKPNQIDRYITALQQNADQATKNAQTFLKDVAYPEKKKQAKQMIAINEKAADLQNLLHHEEELRISARETQKIRDILEKLNRAKLYPHGDHEALLDEANDIGGASGRKLNKTVDEYIRGPLGRAGLGGTLNLIEHSVGAAWDTSTGFLTKAWKGKMGEGWQTALKAGGGIAAGLIAVSALGKFIDQTPVLNWPIIRSVAKLALFVVAGMAVFNMMDKGMLSQSNGGQNTHLPTDNMYSDISLRGESGSVPAPLQVVDKDLTNKKGDEDGEDGKAGGGDSRGFNKKASKLNVSHNGQNNNFQVTNADYDPDEDADHKHEEDLCITCQPHDGSNPETVYLDPDKNAVLDTQKEQSEKWTSNAVQGQGIHVCSAFVTPGSDCQKNGGNTHIPSNLILASLNSDNQKSQLGMQHVLHEDSLNVERLITPAQKAMIAAQNNMHLNLEQQRPNAEA